MAPCHIGHPRQIGQERSGAILSIQAHHGVLWWELVALKVGVDGRHRSAQFRPVLAVARVAERAEPLVGVRLQDRGVGADDFAPLAPHVARRAEGAQAALGGRSVRGVGQGALASRFSCTIDLED